MLRVVMGSIQLDRCRGVSPPHSTNGFLVILTPGKKKQPAVGAAGNVLCQSQRAPLALVCQAKCSAQEIERKKQQALERRRRRLQGGGRHPQMRSAGLL